MNLDPFGSNAGGPLAPADWTMTLSVEQTGEVLFYYADLHRAGARICRLVLTGGVRSEQEVRRLLVLKARLWIADYLSRPHTGTTVYSPLT
jgi:hypothetical protein